MLSRIALGGIHAYQRWVSPRKGYRCAHAVLHGGPGCSGFAKHAIRDKGLLPALPHIRARFADCRAAFDTLQDRRDEGDDQSKGNNRCANGAGALCDGAMCCPSGAATGRTAAGGAAEGGCGLGGGAGCSTCDLAGGCAAPCG